MTVVTQNKIDILVGMISPFGMSSVPTGWLACDGSAISRTTYADLFTAIGTTWGAGDGSSTFALPDLQGAFLRGTGTHNTHQDARENGSAHFAGLSVGSFQDDQFQAHEHSYTYWGWQTSTGYASGKSYVLNDQSNMNATITTHNGALVSGSNGTPRSGTETRPFNAGVKYCIKY